MNWGGGPNHIQSPTMLQRVVLIMGLGTQGSLAKNSGYLWKTHRVNIIWRASFAI